MRAAVLATLLSMPALPAAAVAQTSVSAHLQHWVDSHDVGQLRTELVLQQATRDEAARTKSDAYRSAHLLYKNCERELRAFCLLSSSKMMRDADAAYRESEKRDFPHIAALEKALAVLEQKPTAAQAAAR